MKTRTLPGWQTALWRFVLIESALTLTTEIAAIALNALHHREPMSWYLVPIAVAGMMLASRNLRRA